MPVLQIKKQSVTETALWRVLESADVLQDVSIVIAPDACETVKRLNVPLNSQDIPVGNIISNAISQSGLAYSVQGDAIFIHKIHAEVDDNISTNSPPITSPK
jgi:hypothetical protein